MSKYRMFVAAILMLMLLGAFSAAPVWAASGCSTSDHSSAKDDASSVNIVFTCSSYDMGPAGKKSGAAGARSNKVVVKDIDYDRSDREVEFEFKGSVQWKSPTVKITKYGKNYVRYIKSKDSDELEVKVNKLNIGDTYSYRITGVKNRTGSKYQVVTGTFRAKND